MRYIVRYLLVMGVILMPFSITASEDVPASEKEDTMLMFVGETIDVLSIASRREESAWQAPAIAQVIHRKDLKLQGAETLGQALSLVPGFFMAQKEGGILPYLRGIPNSALFLYDTVPLGLDTTKSVNPLGYDLSLSSVKRIEIIRGSGSVLWGPDAFAGIVNIVPMSGKDLEGVETGISYGMPGNQQAFYINAGHDNDNWDAFFSLSGRQSDENDRQPNLIKFWGNGEKPIPYFQRIGTEQIKDAHYLEASGRVSFQDWLTVSGRVSDNLTPYAMSDSGGNPVWQESRSTPSGMFKLEAKKDTGQNSALRFMSSYSLIRPEYQIIDLDLKQEESTFYSEMIYDRFFFSRSGLFTGGVSYREKRIKNAPIWKDYLPDFLGPLNESAFPKVSTEDYQAKLISVFGQYSQKIGETDVWFGVRDDEHDIYKDHVSFNTGAAWSPSSQWIFKLLYGTAYRTPFARQLLGGEEPDLEKIKSLSGQVSWKPVKQIGMSLSVFSSRIENHIMEDPYAGLSFPNNQNIMGLEFETNLSPTKDIDLYANMTLLNNDGPDETYKYTDYYYIREDGTRVRYYLDIAYPYNIGPKFMANISGTWRPFEKVSTFIRLGYVSSERLVLPRGDGEISFSGGWLSDMNTTIQDIMGSGTELGISVRNLSNRHNNIPGTYSAIESSPFSVEIIIRKKW